MEHAHLEVNSGSAFACGPQKEGPPCVWNVTSERLVARPGTPSTSPALLYFLSPAQERERLVVQAGHRL